MAKLTDKNRLSLVFPDIAAQWHPVLNENLTPNDVTYGSSKEVWWLCEKCSEPWLAFIYSKCRSNSKKNGCPYCSGQKVCNNNSLSFLRPDIAKQWHPTKNKPLTSHNVTCGSQKKVWWVCENGHEHQSIIKNKVIRNGCKFCSGKEPCKDNCLATLRPDLAAQWHPTLNGDLTAKNVTCGNSKEKVHWVCEKGHEWPALVVSRASGNGCPYCGGKKVCEDNCLATLRPDIAAQWHPTKNGDLTPHDFTCGSGERVWWQCENGHEWGAMIFERSKGNKSCDECTSLSFLRPDIAKQWHPTKNDKLIPKDFYYKSGKEVWWQCENGHEWRAKILERVIGNKNCKECISLAFLRPDVTKQWHPTKNGNLTPKDFTCGSHKEVWWKCENGHEWVAAVCERIRRNGTNCPQCSKGSISKVSQEWLDLLNIARENREILLLNLNYKVDAFVPETNTIYEFFGDYWHGNPKKYSAAEKNSNNGKTFGELYEETKTRVIRLEEAGYKVIYIWENDYLELVKNKGLYKCALEPFL